MHSNARILCSRRADHYLLWPFRIVCTHTHFLFAIKSVVADRVWLRTKIIFNCIFAAFRSSHFKDFVKDDNNKPKLRFNSVVTAHTSHSCQTMTSLECNCLSIANTVSQLILVFRKNSVFSDGRISSNDLSSPTSRSVNAFPSRAKITKFGNIFNLFNSVASVRLLLSMCNSRRLEFNGRSSSMWVGVNVKPLCVNTKPLNWGIRANSTKLMSWILLLRRLMLKTFGSPYSDRPTCSNSLLFILMNVSIDSRSKTTSDKLRRLLSSRNKCFSAGKSKAPSSIDRG